MSDFELDLPDELQGGRTRAKEPKTDLQNHEVLLAQLGETIGEKRDAAVKARAESGIEDIWKACEEAYLGIDDSNRAEFAGAKWIKPTSMSGPVTVAKEDRNNAKSTAFVRLTSRYVDMATAKICEIALPIDDKAFSIGPTPIPELVTALNDQSPVIHPMTGQQVMLPGKDPEQPGTPGQAPKPMTRADIAQHEIDAAAECAEKAEKRIWDWMTECGYPAEMRTVIHDSARIGTGAIKGPFPEMVTSKAMSKAGGGLKMTIVQKSSLAAKWIDVWNLFPDGACGEDIHSGDHILERDFLSRSTLKKLKREVDSLGVPIYMAKQIDKVLLEGPEKCNVEGGNPNVVVNKDRFTIWYFTGTIKKSDMKLTNAIGIDELPEDMDDVYAVITLVNDTVIRATVNPLETGNFPYRVLPWSRRAGSWTGVGVGEQVSLPQRVVNGGTRALLNNAGVTSGSQIIIDPVGLVPADGSPIITPLKVWHKTADAATQDVRGLFMAVDIPNQYQPLMAIIQYGMKMAEEASSIPLISQGQQGEKAPQTFGEAELQNNNANALLRSIGLRLDDFITEPLVQDFYEMLLLDPSIPDEEKGDFQIVANGTLAMVEKAIQEQTMLQAAQLIQNPAFGINPKKWFEEYWKTKRLDPRKIQFTEDELANMAKQSPPEAPAIVAAKIRAASAEKIAQENGAIGLQKVKADTDRDNVYVQSEAERAKSVADVAIRKLELEEKIANLDYQIKLMEFAQNEKISLNEAKTKLAETAMKLNVQKELSSIDRAQDLHKHRNPSPVIKPPTEPAGRAAPGEAFQA